jgi:hypothetical protein
MTPGPLILYSVNTYLAYRISERYYGQHHVWCSPCFDSRSSYNLGLITNPPTSNPSEIYHNLLAEVQRGDRHSSKIIDNKAGILQGVVYNRGIGVISEEETVEITAVVNNAETRDFKPLLYVIPFAPVASLVIDVPVHERAHPLSTEFRIERLPRALFDIIELEKM